MSQCAYVRENTSSSFTCNLRTGPISTTSPWDLFFLKCTLFLWSLVEVWSDSDLTGKPGNEEHLNFFQISCGHRWSHTFLRHVLFHFLWSLFLFSFVPLLSSSPWCAVHFWFAIQASSFLHQVAILTFTFQDSSTLKVSISYLVSPTMWLLLNSDSLLTCSLIK